MTKIVYKGYFMSKSVFVSHEIDEKIWKTNIVNNFGIMKSVVIMMIVQYFTSKAHILTKVYIKILIVKK